MIARHLVEEHRGSHPRLDQVPQQIARSDGRQWVVVSNPHQGGPFEIDALKEVPSRFYWRTHPHVLSAGGVNQAYGPRKNFLRNSTMCQTRLDNWTLRCKLPSTWMSGGWQ